jgi:molybdopterin biosynthesis enzyme
MMGYPAERWDRPRVEAVADDALARRPDGKTHFFRVVCRWDHDAGGYRVTPAGKQGSHQLVAMARANALAELPDGDGVEAGEPVSVLLLR